MPPKLQCFNCGTNGHGVRECPDISCHYCHGLGHIVDNCPKKRHRSPVCSDSDSERNAGERNTHSNAVCRECGRKGHIARSCPTRRDSGAGGNTTQERKCFFCKRKGHQISDCDLKKLYPNEEKLCYMCLKPGHHANECSNEAVCHLCGESGHISTDCPNRNCNNCHTQGHATGRCPSVRCYKCNENGHMANECDDDANSTTATTTNTNTSAIAPTTNNNNISTNTHTLAREAPVSTGVSASASTKSGHAVVSGSPSPSASLPPYTSSFHTAGTVTASSESLNHYHQLQQPKLVTGIGGPAGTPTFAAAPPFNASQHHTVGSMVGFSHPSSSAAPHLSYPQQANAPTYSNPQPQGYAGHHGTAAAAGLAVHPPSHPQGPPPPFPGHTQQAAAVIGGVAGASSPSPLPAIPALDESSLSSRGSNGRVCVLIDGAYFESCVKQQSGALDGGVAEYSRVRLALQHTLQQIGAIFDKTPYGFWFDMDPSSLIDFVEQEFSAPLRESTLRRIHTKHTELIAHMCGGRGLSNVVTRLVGKIRHRPVVTSSGFGASWMPAGVDVAIATSIVECFESKQFSQVVLLSGDGALCPAVDFCNTRRQGCSFEGSKAPVRVCGTMNTMDSLFGARQELVDFLPRIFLDAPEHIEEGRKTAFAIAGAFK